MAELDDVKKAAIAAAISAYLSDAGAAALPFSPRMFLRDVKGAGAWGSSSRKTLGSSGYRKGSATRMRQFFGNGRA